MKFKRILSLFLVMALVFSFLPVSAAAAKPDAPIITVSNILSSGCIRLTWKAVENGKYYRIYRSATETGGYTKIKTTSSLSYTDKDAQPGETWYYLIKTVSPEGTVSSSSKRVSGTAKLPRPTVTLSGVSASGKIQVSWKKIDGASSYRVYRSTDKSSWKLLKKTTSRSYTDNSAAAEQKYYYRVLAVLGSNTAGNSAYSSPKSRTCDLSRPVVSVSNDAASGRVQLRWEPVEGAVRYRVYRAESEDGKYTKIRSPEETAFTDTSASEDVTYYYKVMATASNSEANSAYSLPVSGTYACPKGLTLTVAANEACQAYLTWNAVSGAAGYRVYRSYRGTEGFKLLSTRTALYYTNASAPARVGLYYYVEAVDKGGNVLETSDTQYLYLQPDYSEAMDQMYVRTPSLTIYQTPETTCAAGTLRYMDEVLLGSLVTGNWYRVYVDDSAYFIYGTDKLTHAKSDFAYTGTTKLQQEVLDLAMDICLNWNTVYATGQSNGVANADGTYGFNAPGLVKYILNTVMQKKVPFFRLSQVLDTLYATDTLYNAGYPGEAAVLDVSMEQLRSGDVLFFGSSAAPDSCGLYLGDGEFLYASGAWADGVCIMPLNSYLDELMAIRRYLPEEVISANTQKSLVGSYKNYKLYETDDSTSAVVKTLNMYDSVTVLFTDSGNWAYVQTEDGTRGYVLEKYLGDYEYLDHVILSGALNTEGKPTFTWNSVKNAASYQLYRSLRPNAGFELVGSTENTYYSNLAAPGGLTFYYQLRVLDETGSEIDVSDIVAVTTELEEAETLQTRYVYLPVVNLYELPEISSEPVALRYMEQVQLGLPVITREDGSWYRVFRQDRLYYLWSSDINESLTDTKNSLDYTGNTVYQQQVIDLALEISEEWKTIYAHEQSNGVPNADGSCGFDCSGLTSYIFNRVMQPYVPTYRLYAALETQHATTGMYNDGYPGQFSATDVAAEDLQPGDILFFTSLADGTASTEIGHCGIYLGNNEFIHATSSWEDAVCIMGLRGSYLENYVGARRYLPEAVVSANAETSIVGNYKSYNLYAQQNSESAVVATLAQYDPLTVLFTDNDLWAYVRTEDGAEGFFLTEHLGEYEYLEYVKLCAALNDESKPALTWNKVKNAETYEVYRSIREAEGYSLLSTTTNTYYTNNTVPQGMTLYYKVRALDANGVELDVSDAVSVKVPLAETEVPVTRYVNVSSVKLYELPETAAPSVTVRYMDEIQLGCVATGAWHRAFLNGKLYYLYMTEGDGKLTNAKSSFSYTGNTALQQEILDLATDICLNWNTVYATGQSNGVANADGTYGFNAPGLVKYIFNTVMEPKVPFYQLSQVLDTLYTTTELYSTGYPGAFAACDVAEADMEPGDVLFFGDAEPTYCGIYLGSGEFIYCAASWSDGVCIMPLKDFADALIQVRRYLPEEVIASNTAMTVSGPYRNYKVYAEKSASSTVVATLAQGDSLTVLYTDCGNWAMVRTSDGTVGYFLTKYLV